MALWGWAKSLAKGANCDSKHASSDKRDTSDGHKHTDDSIKHKTQRSIPGAWDLMEDEDGDEDGLRSDQKSEPPAEDNLKTSDSTERHNGLSMPGGWEDEGDNEAESRREGEGDSDVLVVAGLGADGGDPVSKKMRTVARTIASSTAASARILRVLLCRVGTATAKVADVGSGSASTKVGGRTE